MHSYHVIDFAVIDAYASQEISPRYFFIRKSQLKLFLLEYNVIQIREQDLLLKNVVL